MRMIQSTDVMAVERTGKDWETAEKIKADLLALRGIRQPYYLTADDLAPVLRYKLRGQEGRTSKHRKDWSPELVRALTTAAFAVQEPDREIDLQVRVALLTGLPGVGVPVASAILALTQPERYAILDFRVWRQIFGTAKKSFRATDYVAYMREIWLLSAELQWQPQVVDWCIWRRDQVT